MRAVSPATAGRTGRNAAATDRATHGRAQATQVARNWQPRLVAGAQPASEGQSLKNGARPTSAGRGQQLGAATTAAAYMQAQQTQPGAAAPPVPPAPPTPAAQTADYDALLARLDQLEQQHHAQVTAAAAAPPPSAGHATGGGRGTHDYAGAPVCDGITTLEEGVEGGGMHTAFINGRHGRDKAQMATVSSEWAARQALGIRGITKDQQAGASGRALAAYGIGRATSTSIGSRSLHQLGMSGSPYPAGAPAGDKSLLNHPSTLPMFYAQGVYNARTATKSFQLARSVEGELRFAEGSTPEAITPSTTCRFIFLIADMRLDWLISIPDPTHPHFLPLEKIAAARRYNWWLGVQELSHDFTEIEQLDAQLMFERFNGNWDFDMAVDAADNNLAASTD